MQFLIRMIRVIRGPSYSVCVLILLFIASGRGNACADRVSQSSDFAFRFLFIDSEQIAAWSQRGQKFLPIQRDELTRLLKNAKATVQDSVLNCPRVLSSRIDVRLEDDATLRGTADLEIHYPSGPTRLLPLKTDGLAVSEAVWVLSDGKITPAVWGTFGWTDTAERIRQEAHVERSGTLRLRFTACGQHDPHGELHFLLGFPTAPIRKLALDFPRKYAPTIAGAHILHTEATTEDRRRVDYQLGSRPPAGDNKGGGVSIVIHDPATHRSRLQAASVRQHTHYEVDERGVRVTADFWITSADDLPDSFRLQAGTGFAVTAVEIGDQPAKWVIEGKLPDGQTRIHISSTGNGPMQTAHVIVHGLADAPFGQAWTLPTMRLKDIFWSQGSVIFSVSESLLVQHIECLECARTAMALGSPEASGDSKSRDERGDSTYSFVEYTSDATINVRLTRRLAKPLVSPLSIAIVGAQEIATSTVVDLPNAAGGQTVTLPISDGWTIDSVECLPNGIVRDWFIRDERDASRLRVILSPTAGQKSEQGRRRLIVRGRRHACVELLDLLAADLRMVPLSSPIGQSVTGHLSTVYVRPAQNYRLRRTDGGSLETVSLIKHAPGLLAALGETEDSVLYSMPPHTEEATVRLQRRGPEYDADVRVRAEFVEDVLRQTLDILVTPREGRMHDVVIDVEGGMAGKLEWQIVGTPAEDSKTVKAVGLPSMKPIAAHRVSHRVIESTGNVFASWKLSLASRDNEPIRLRAFANSALDNAGAVLMAVARGAASQTGRIEVRCTPTSAVAVEAVGFQVSRRDGDGATSTLWQNAPVGDAAANLGVSNHIPNVCGVYQFDPARDVGELARSSLHIRRNHGMTAAPWAWIRDAELRTVVSQAGMMRHTSILNVETTSLDRFLCQLPENAESVSLTVDGKSMTVNQREQDSDTITVILPPNKRFAHVEIRCAIPSKPLNIIHLLQPIVIKPSLPVASWQWSVSAPTGYSVATHLEAEVGLCKSVWKRLQGPLQCRSVSPRPTLVANMDAPVHLVHVQTIWLLGLLACIGVIALFVGPLVNRGWVRLGIGCAAFAAALVLPVTVAPVAGGAFLGVVAAMLARLARIAFTVMMPGRSQVTESTIFVTAARSIGFALIVLINSAPSRADVSQTNGQPPAPAEDPTNKQAVKQRPSPHQILIPIDKDRRPVGESLFLSDRFYRLLLALERQKQHAAGDWIIVRARYSGSASTSGNGGDNDYWTAAFDIHSFRPNVVVRLPLRQEEADWGEHAVIDGAAVPMKWLGDEMGYSVRLAESGDHSVRLRFIPLTQRHDEAREWTIRIPKVADSTLVIPGTGDNGDAERIDVFGAIFSEHREGKRHFTLGSADRLTLRQEATHSTPESNSVPDLSPRLWLRIAYEGIWLDMRLRVPSGVKSVALKLDPLLKFLGQHTGMAADSGSPEVEITVDGSNALRLQTEQPLKEPVDVLLRFELSGDSGVGRFRLPYIGFPGPASREYALGVSVDNCLESEFIPDASIVPIEPAEFAQSWSEGALPPTVAYSCPIARRATPFLWTARIRKPTLHANEKLACLFDGRGAGVRYRAEVDVRNGTAMQHVFTVSDGLKIESIHTTLGEESLPCHWARNQSSELTLYFDKPVRGLHTIELGGRLTFSASERVAIPAVRLHADKYGGNKLELRRTETVAVDLEPTDDFLPLPREGDQIERFDTSRLIGRYQYDGARGYSAFAKVEENTPVVSVNAIMTLRKQKGSWNGDWECELDVRDGAVDHLELLASDNWAGPFDALQNAIVRVHEGPCEDMRRIIVDFDEPVRGLKRIRLCSPVVEPEDAPFRLPNVIPQGVDASFRFVALPQNSGEQRLDWATDKLVPSPVPSWADSDRNAWDKHAIYRVVGPDFQASPRKYIPRSDSPFIASAILQALQPRDGAMDTMAWIQLHPEGETACDVELSDGCELRQLSVSGVPVAPEKNEQVDRKTRWRVPLDTSPFPRMLCIHYRINGWTTDTLEPLSLPSPRLLIKEQPIPARRVEWVLPTLETRIPRPSGAIESAEYPSPDSYRFIVSDLGPITVAWIRRDGATSVHRASVAALLLLAVCGWIPLVRFRLSRRRQGGGV